MKPGKQFWLITIVMASIGCYLWLAIRYPLGPSLENPRATWANLVAPTGWNAFLHLALYLGLTLLYLAVLRILAAQQGESATQHRWQIRVIVATWLACCGALLAAAPGGESHDIFDYLFRGRMMVEYGSNPLVDVPDEYNQATPYALYVAWRKHVDTYGPVWEASSAFVATSVRQAAGWLGWWDESDPSCPKSTGSCRLLMAYITGYRLLAIFLTGISGWLIAGMVRLIQPALVPLALAVWLLNPMTLIATALGGHNDAVMLVLILLGWWLLQRQHALLALLSLTLAAHVKLTALIWLPACALWIVWRLGWRRALQVGLAWVISGLGVSWLLYTPFGGWNSLLPMLHERSLFLANSIWRILKHLLVNQWGWPVDRAHQLSIGLPGFLFAIGALLAPWKVFYPQTKSWRGLPTTGEGADQKLWNVFAAMSMLYLIIGSFWFQPWYVLWAIAPTALLPASRFTRSIIPWLVFGALSMNVAMDFLITTVMKTTPPIQSYLLAVGIIWGPALIATGIQIFHVHVRAIRPPIASESV